MMRCKNAKLRGKVLSTCVVCFVLSVCIVFLAAAETSAQETAAPDAGESLTGRSLAELLELRVTSVSKKSETVSDASAAVFVITREDIRRSGATSLPDVMRMAPGVEVAQTHDNDWYVSIRGFNEESENKLLVLIDGRTIYSPIMSGVFWYEQDIVLEDIERIEVIRGPGASMWGANAVNGVINIITRHAKDMQGGMLSAAAGTFDRAFASGRYGFEMGDHGFGAVWVKYFDKDQLDSDRNADLLIPRDWESIMFGFRYDWDPPTPSAVTVNGAWHEIQADDRYYLHYMGPPYIQVADYRRHGNLYHVLGRYAYRTSETSEFSAQFYADSDHNDYGNADLRYSTYDAETQYRFPVGERHDIVCGGGYRLITDRLIPIPGVSAMFFTPVKTDLDWVNFFVEDEIRLLRDKLSLKGGCKFEHNDYTGWEIQPTARFLVRPVDNHVLWCAVSRAVRTPSRYDADTNGGVTYPPPTLPPPLNQTGLFGRMEAEKGEVDAEEMIAYELGYRLQPSSRFWFDAAAYYNDYDKLMAFESLSDGFEIEDDPPHYERRIRHNNGMEGRSFGGEAAAALSVCPNWTLIGTYSYLNLDLDFKPGSSGISKITVDEGNSPEHQFSIRSLWDVTRRWECDVWLRYVDELPNIGVDSYTTFDVRLAWQISNDLEFSVVGRNLAEQWHYEFRAYEVERSVHGKLTWLF